jgi:hypothetical protein
VALHSSLNACSAFLFNVCSRLQYIINMHPLVGVAALAPHVADIIRTRMRMDWVHWVMPTCPLQCTNECWEGYAVQGK